jgi:hypothetical protein
VIAKGHVEEAEDEMFRLERKPTVSFLHQPLAHLDIACERAGACSRNVFIGGGKCPIVPSKCLTPDSTFSSITDLLSLSLFQGS